MECISAQLMSPKPARTGNKEEINSSAVQGVNSLLSVQLFFFRQTILQNCRERHTEHSASPSKVTWKTSRTDTIKEGQVSLPAVTTDHFV